MMSDLLFEKRNLGISTTNHYTVPFDNDDELGEDTEANVVLMK
jgi:hypothetical protein